MIAMIEGVMFGPKFRLSGETKRKSQQQPKRSESTEPEVKRKITNNKTNADIWNSIMDHTKNKQSN